MKTPYACGKAAYKRGAPLAPVLDREFFRNFLLNRRLSDPATRTALSAWARGWMSEDAKVINKEEARRLRFTSKRSARR